MNYHSSQAGGVALGVACCLLFACGRLEIGSHGDADLAPTGGQPSATGGTPSSGSSSGAGGQSGMPGASGGAGGQSGMPGANGGEGGQSGAAGTSAGANGQSGMAGASGGASGKAGDVGGDSAGQGGAPEAVRIVELATGSSHNCVRLSNGRVRCWGSSGALGLARGFNVHYMIGDDETPASAGDINVGGRAIQVAVGDYATYAVLDTGKLRSWGAGPGQGHGNSNDIGDDEPPSAAGDVEIGEPVLQVFAGPHRACALLEGGAVRCWGFHEHGVLGYPDLPDFGTVGDDETPASVGDVDAGGPVAQMAFGFDHVCAVLTTGSLRCWGQGAWGSLGYGNTNDIGDDETPASAGDVDVGGDVRQVAASGYVTCVALVDGSVRCWGERAPLQLGAPSRIGDDETPGSVPAIEVGGHAVSVSVAGDHACALLDTGRVRCWGNGRNVALGYGNIKYIGDDETPASAGDLQLGGLVAQLGTEYEHTCALLQNGYVRCWGGTPGLDTHALSTVPLGLPFLQEPIGDNEFPDRYDPLEILGP